MSAAGHFDSILSRRLWGLGEMLRVYAKPFIEASELIGQLMVMILDPNVNALAEETKTVITEKIDSLTTQLDAMGLDLTKQSALRLRAHVNLDGVTPRQCRDYLVQTKDRLTDQIDLVFLLRLSPAEITMYEPSRPLFGKEVDDKLSQAIEDVAEAGKCFALGRYTACMFHLMRVVETGVQKFGDKLGVQFTDQKVWQVILDGINAEIKKLGKSAYTKKYASISAHLYNVKLAWRNELMHPKATYTAEEAEVIFGAVRGFMIDLVGVL